MRTDLEVMLPIWLLLWSTVLEARTKKGKETFPRLNIWPAAPPHATTICYPLIQTKQFSYPKQINTAAQPGTGHISTKGTLRPNLPHLPTKTANIISNTASPNLKLHGRLPATSCQSHPTPSLTTLCHYSANQHHSHSSHKQPASTKECWGKQYPILC